MPMLTNSSFREKSRCASGLLEGCLRLPRGSGPCAADAAAAQKALIEKSACNQVCFRAMLPCIGVFNKSLPQHVWCEGSQGSEQQRPFLLPTPPCTYNFGILWHHRGNAKEIGLRGMTCCSRLSRRVLHPEQHIRTVILRRVFSAGRHPGGCGEIRLLPHLPHQLL